MNNEKYTDLKPGFGIFESGFSFFLLGALYVISLKSFITLRLLKQFLWIFCISVFTFNFVILFYLTGTDFFTNIGAATSYLYDSRFGSTKLLLGGKVYLDAQALHIYAAALFAYFLAILQRNRAEKIIAFVFFVVFIWFLSLTVTKSSILSFLCGFMVLNICFYKKIFHYKWLLIGVFVLLGVIGGIFMPSSFGERWQQLKSEINDVREGNLAGGSSITPRVVFYKSCFDHFDTFALWGLGVYTNPVSKQWYRNSGNSVVAKLTHSHNSYLQYWMIGGIPGLLFILSWFIFPLWRMIKNKCYCFLTLAIMLAFFIDCNNEVLLIVSDSTPVIIFFLAMFYIHNDKFCLLEKSLGQVKE